MISDNPNRVIAPHSTVSTHPNKKQWNITNQTVTLAATKTIFLKLKKKKKKKHATQIVFIPVGRHINSTRVTIRSHLKGLTHPKPRNPIGTRVLPARFYPLAYISVTPTVELYSLRSILLFVSSKLIGECFFFLVVLCVCFSGKLLVLSLLEFFSAKWIWS